MEDNEGKTMVVINGREVWLDKQSLALYRWGQKDATVPAATPVTIIMARPKVEYDPLIKLMTGRLPVLSRAQLNAIRMDDRPLAVIARDPRYATSVTTIMKAKRAGRWRNFEYVPWDEHVRLTDKSMARQEQQTPKGRSTTGREFASGRAEITPWEHCAILYDPRGSKEIAEFYMVSRPYVYKLWRAAGIDNLNRNKVAERNDIVRIMEDERAYDTIASFYKIDVKHVRYIKDGWSDEFPPSMPAANEIVTSSDLADAAASVTSEGNDDNEEG